ncbi:MAG TPA: HD domain-containing protein [Candidatus Deferrimicrobium sp.]|nr:HD domain-containing protein [Candidatus Deferrimicrobium sp.]
MEALIDLAKQIENAELRETIISFLESPTTSIETFGDELTIEEAPASKRVHHSYKGGLIEHTIAVTSIAIEIINVLQKVYQIDFISRDLTIAGALLHDIYKPLTYAKSGSAYERSRLGSKIDHTSLIFGEALHRKLPLELLHIILSHHGKGSSAQPRSLEALVLHLADYIDSQLLGDILLGAESIIKRAGRRVKIDNSKFAAFICKLMTTKGIQGVKEYLDTL